MRNFVPFLRGRYALSWLVPVLACAPARASDPLQDLGKTTSEWVKTRAETGRIESAWAQDRALLASTLNGLKERAERLQEKRDHLLAATADERAELAALTAKLADAKESVKESETRLLALSEKILRLRPRLPPRLSSALELPCRTLAAREASPGERMQVAIAVLNRCAQFNLSIEQGDDILLLPGETAPKSVDVIYWGLSHGYALDRTTGRTWLGGPGPDGWRWEKLEGGAPAVAMLFAIRRDEADPQTVMVPARLQTSTRGTP